MENWIPIPTCDPPPLPRPDHLVRHGTPRATSLLLLFLISPSPSIHHQPTAGNLTHHLTGHNPEAVGKAVPQRQKTHLDSKRKQIENRLRRWSWFHPRSLLPPLPPPPRGGTVVGISLQGCLQLPPPSKLRPAAGSAWVRARHPPQKETHSCLWGVSGNTPSPQGPFSILHCLSKLMPRKCKIGRWFPWAVLGILELMMLETGTGRWRQESWATGRASLESTPLVRPSLPIPWKQPALGQLLKGVEGGGLI